MALSDLVARSRSYRRFHQNHAVTVEQLHQLVALARLTPSAGNAQPLKYFVSADPVRNAQIFPHLSWAAQLCDWPGPADGERPAGYIIVLGDRRLKPSCGFVDQGIAAQTVLLGAVELGLGGVIIGAVKREALSETLGLGADLEVLLVLALGHPKEEVVIEPLPSSGSTLYWRDEALRHHVPKRPLEDLLVPGGAR